MVENGDYYDQSFQALRKDGFIMKDYVKLLPQHIKKYVGENDLFLESYVGEKRLNTTTEKPPLLFVHGAYTGSWMWSKYIPHFIKEGFNCYVMNMRSH